MHKICQHRHSNLPTFFNTWHAVYTLYSYTDHFYRMMARTMPLQDVSPSVRLSAHPAHVGILSKWLHISSNFGHRWVAPPF